MTPRLRTAVLCAALIAAKAQGQNPLEIKPTAESNGLTGPIEIRLQIKNISADTYIDVTQARVLLPISMVSAGRRATVEQMVTGDLDPQESMEVLVTVPEIEWYNAFRPVFFQWRQNTATAVLHGVVHRPEAEMPQEQDFHTTIDITPAPSLILIVAGGIVGVLLLIAFYAAVKPLRLSRKAIRKQFEIGVIAVVIFCLISKVTQKGVVPLPIAIDVRDFYGGVVLGLFSNAVVAEFLRLTGREKGSAGGRTG